MALEKVLLFIASYHLKAVACSASHAKRTALCWHRKTRNVGFIQTFWVFRGLVPFLFSPCLIVKTMLCLEEPRWVAAKDLKTQRNPSLRVPHTPLPSPEAPHPNRNKQMGANLLKVQILNFSVFNSCYQEVYPPQISPVVLSYFLNSWTCLLAQHWAEIQ